MPANDFPPLNPNAFNLPTPDEVPGRRGKTESEVRNSLFWQSDLDFLLPVKIANALDRHGIKTIGQLADLSADDIASFRDCGPVTVRVCSEQLAHVGLYLASESPPTPINVVGPMEQALRRIAELEDRQRKDADWIKTLQDRIEKLELNQRDPFPP